MINKIFFILLLIVFVSKTKAQQVTAEQILSRSIKHHDPKGEWKEFDHEMNFTSERPDKPDRKSKVYINNNKGLFELTEENNDMGIVMDSCTRVPTGKTCDQVKRMRNYYVYLWGLPMKLKDEGTVLDPAVRTENFEGMACYVLRVPYEKDVWFFYIDKSNYALKAYKFLTDEPANKGEVIYLDGESRIGNMRIPQKRKWVTLPEGEVLGTDILTSWK